MNSLISKAFLNAKSENRPALLTYTVAGDYNKKQSLKILYRPLKILYRPLKFYTGP